MRLTCPSCAAQYDVDDHVMPSDGRDVQCSNCGHTWFERPEAADRDLATELGLSPKAFKSKRADEEAALDAAKTGDAPKNLFIQRVREMTKTNAWEGETTLAAEVDADDHEMEGDSRPSPRPERRKVDSKVMEILREEAEREQAERAKERHLRAVPDPASETVMDPPQDDATDDILAEAPEDEAEPAAERTPGTRPSDKLGAAIAQAAAEPKPEEDVAAVAAAAALTRRTATRSELLPDVEELNSTLQGSNVTTDTDSEARSAAIELLKIQQRRMRRAQGFRLGFSAALLLVTGLLFLYMHAPTVAQRVPALEGPLTQYAGAINQGRLWLDEVLTDAVAARIGDG